MTSFLSQPTIAKVNMDRMRMAVSFMAQ
jgi:hypothetical protein